MLQGRAVMTADRVVRDSVQPGEQRLPAIIVCADPLYSAEKHRRRKVLRDMVVGYPGVYVAIDLRVMAGGGLVPFPPRTRFWGGPQPPFGISRPPPTPGDPGGGLPFLKNAPPTILHFLCRGRGP